MNRNVNGKPPVKEDDYSKKPQPMMLIHEIVHLMGDKLREKGDDNPIGQKSGRLLMMELSHKDGRTQLELVKATHLKAPTISVALQKLEHEGYVVRKPDAYDMRAMRVFLTEKGRELDNKLKKRIAEEEAAATSILTEEECETLTVLLKKIRSNILANSNEGEEL